MNEPDPGTTRHHTGEHPTPRHNRGGEGPGVQDPATNPAPSPTEHPESHPPSSFRRRPESTPGAGLEIRGLEVSLGGGNILVGLDLSAQRGEILALLGPSGCGKTTLLRAVAGLLTPDAGSVHWAGSDLRPVPAHRRRFGMVFQDHALLPHRNVGANVAFGLRMQNVPAPERRRRVAEMLRMVGLEGYERRSVATLSGGEAQRVALARALVTEPKLLLADEPFAALDRPLHDRLLADVRRILSELHQTAIHVTHDHAEAFALADRVALMRAGHIHRTATPQQLRDDPQDAWTATFLGLGTIWRARAGGAAGVGAAARAAGVAATPRPAAGPGGATEITTPWGLVNIAAITSTRPRPGDRTTGGAASPSREEIAAGRFCLLIRPEAVRSSGESGCETVLSDIRVTGDRTIATLEVPGAPPLHGYVPAGIAAGHRYRIALDPEGISTLRPDL